MDNNGDIPMNPDAPQQHLDAQPPQPQDAANTTARRSMPLGIKNRMRIDYVSDDAAPSPPQPVRRRNNYRSDQVRKRRSTKLQPAFRPRLARPRATAPQQPASQVRPVNAASGSGQTTTTKREQLLADSVPTQTTAYLRMLAGLTRTSEMIKDAPPVIINSVEDVYLRQAEAMQAQLSEWTTSACSCCGPGTQLHFYNRAFLYSVPRRMDVTLHTLKAVCEQCDEVTTPMAETYHCICVPEGVAGARGERWIPLQEVETFAVEKLEGLGTQGMWNQCTYMHLHQPYACSVPQRRESRGAQGRHLPSCPRLRSAAALPCASCLRRALYHLVGRRSGPAGPLLHVPGLCPCRRCVYILLTCTCAIVLYLGTDGSNVRPSMDACLKPGCRAKEQLGEDAMHTMYFRDAQDLHGLRDTV